MSGKKKPGRPRSTEDSELNDRMKKFVAHYSVHCNGAAAVRHAGYTTQHANGYAVELLSLPHVQKKIEEHRKQLGEQNFDLAQRALARLNAMLAADRTQILDGDGNLLDPEDWPEECKHLLAGIDIEETMIGEGKEAQLVRTKKVKLEGPKGIIDSILKATGKFVERHQQLDSKGRPVDPTPFAVTLVHGELPKKAKA